MVTSSLLLLAISQTILLLLLVVPLLYARQLYRAGRQLAFLPISSSVCASLSGLLGLAALGSGDRGAAVVGGVAGVLAVALLDLHVLVLFWRPLNAGTRARNWSSWLFFLAFSLFALTATILAVVLLCLDSPSRSTLLGITASRAVLHIVFVVGSLVYVVHATISANDRDASPGMTEQGYGTPRRTETYQTWSARAAASLDEPVGPARGATLLDLVENRLVIAQLIAVVLDILAAALPLHPNYRLFDASRRVSPTFFGSTTSSAGYVAFSMLVFFRWALILLEMAGSASNLSNDSKCSLAVHYHRTPTPSPSTVPFETERRDSFSFSARTDSPTTTRRPSTSMSGALAGSPTFTRSTSLWSMTANAHDETLVAPGSTSSPNFGSGKKCGRNVSVSSRLSLGRTQASTLDHTTDSGVEVQTIELQHPYFHTETVPVSYADSSGDESGEAEDLVVTGSPPASPVSYRTSPVSHRSHRSLPTLSTQQFPQSPRTPPPSTPAQSSSAGSSPVFARRNSSSLSYAPLLRANSAFSSLPGAASRGVTPSPFPLETPPSSPERARAVTRSATSPNTPSSAPSTPNQTPSGTLRRAAPPSLVEPHASTASSVVSAYYSLPRSPPAPFLPPAQQSSPKKLRRPSLGTLPSFTGSATTTSSGGGKLKVEDSPTRERNRRRSGSVGSLLKTLKRESTTPSESAAGNKTVTSWDVEPNDEEDDPFAPASLGAGEEGKRQEERVREWEHRRTRSAEALAQMGTSLEAELVQEKSDQEEDEAEGAREETGSIVDHGEEFDTYTGTAEENEDIERVLTPVPMVEEDDLEQTRRAASSSPATARPRRRGSSSSIFVEHLDEEEGDLSSVPLSHSVSAGSLRLGTAGTTSSFSSPPALLHAHSTPTLQPTSTRSTSSPYAAAGERFLAALHANEADRASSPFPARPSDSPSLSKSSSRSTSPLQVFKRAGVSGSSRPSIFAAPSQAASSQDSQPRRGSLSSGAPSIFSSASFTLRKMRAKASSLPFDGRNSTSSDLSFACRGPGWSPGGPNSPQPSPVPPLPTSSTSRVRGSELEQVESLDSASPHPLPPSTFAGGAHKSGRAPWWTKVNAPSSRPSTFYRRSGSPRLSRSASTSSSPSFPSFFRPSSSGSGATSSRSSHGNHRNPRHSSLQIPSSTLYRLSASNLEHPPTVSPFGSAVFLPASSTRSSPEVEPRNSSSSNGQFRSSPLAESALPSPLDEHEQRPFGVHASAKTSRRTFVTARSHHTTNGGGKDSAGTIDQAHLSELDDLVRTFSPGSLPPDPQWPSYGAHESVDSGGGGEDGGMNTSFEFPEGGFGFDSSEEGERSRFDEEDEDEARKEEQSRTFQLTFETSGVEAGGGEAAFSPSSSAFSPLSPTFSSSTDGRERYDLASPITPASFSFGSWGRREEKGEEEERMK